MKNLGWQLFWSLLLADAVALVMVKLSVAPRVIVIVAGLVFVILALVMFFTDRARQRGQKREEQANAKIAELQDQVAEAYNK